MAENSTHGKIEHSTEEKARDKAVRDQLRSHPTPEELVASKEFSEPIPQAVVLDAMALLAQLRESREAVNLTLTALAERTGIDKPALSRLETGRQNNPTLQTILRYVHGLGKRIVWSIVDDTETSLSGVAENKTAPTTVSNSPIEIAAMQQSAKTFVEWLLYAQARVAASLAQGYMEPTRFMCEQMLGRGYRIDPNVWLQPDIQGRLMDSVQVPSACPAPLLTIDCEGRLAFLCSSLPITPQLPVNPMREKLFRALSESGGRIDDPSQEGGLDDCFFCMEMKPGTKFIPLKDIPLPKGSNVPPSYALSEFCICPDCDAKPYEWKEARMVWHIKNHYQIQHKMRELFERFEWPFRIHQRSDGLWVVLDAKGKEIEGLGKEDRDQVEESLQVLAAWHQEESSMPSAADEPLTRK